MEKDFDSWNIQKRNVEILEKEFAFSEREIWWVKLGLNIGHEEDGKNETYERPVLILRKFNKKVAIVLPLTSQGKDSPFYYKLSAQEDSFVILSQVRLVSSKRFLRKMRRLGRGEFDQIKKEFKRLMKL